MRLIHGTGALRPAAQPPRPRLPRRPPWRPPLRLVGLLERLLTPPLRPA